ncbi:MAG: ABC transporter substrate-binding protein [Cyclobacteriaceae bacterium]
MIFPPNHQQPSNGSNQKAMNLHVTSFVLKRIYSFIIITLFPVLLIGQSVQEEYLEAKRLFSTEQYLSAKAAFSNLARSNTSFAPYASFYYGLSAFKSGDEQVAIDQWKQMLNQFPSFDQKAEILYWLSYASFTIGNTNEGISYARRYAETTADNDAGRVLANSFLQSMSMDSLTHVVLKNPKDKLLAEVYVTRSMDLPYTERDFFLIDSLRSLHDLDIATISDVNLPIIKKDQYQVAALLPFMFESLDNTGRILQNNLVTDLYQGMQLAAEDLKREGKLINIVPYDTKRSTEVTQSILSSRSFEQTDLIVGPLYSGPVKAVQDYSLEHMVNMINPISTTSEIIGRNPYSFLLKPTTETMALALADLAIHEMDSNKNVMIFYEQNDKDSLLAAIYRQKLMNVGYQVVWMTPINLENAKTIQDSLTAEHIVYLTKSEADSIMRLPGRTVENRRIRDDELKRIWKDAGDPDGFSLPISYDDNKREIVYYEEVLNMAKDSIGHFLVSTHKSVFSNNLVSVVQARKDSTRIYTFADWLDYTMADYSQFERLGITMIDPDYIDKTKFSFQDVSNRLSKRYKTLPSEYHYLGYELIWFVGQHMNAFGKYFQTGLRGGKFTRGRIFEGMSYGLANDNQVVPILRFKDTELEVVNRSTYGD